jgi:hypothetical protein
LENKFIRFGEEGAGGGGGGRVDKTRRKKVPASSGFGFSDVNQQSFFTRAALIGKYFAKKTFLCPMTPCRFFVNMWKYCDLSLSLSLSHLCDIHPSFASLFTLLIRRRRFHNHSSTALYPTSFLTLSKKSTTAPNQQSKKKTFKSFTDLCSICEKVRYHSSRKATGLFMLQIGRHEI